MQNAHSTLTEKEKQTLRLIVRGHDAKSAARHLGLSVHTINERLRDARRKLAVSSSREAARLLFEQEGTHPEKSADEALGEAPALSDVGGASRPESGRGGWSHPPRTRTGVFIMTISLALLAIVALPQLASTTEGGAAPAEATSPAPRTSALAWLALVDQGRWQESWAATSSSFRQNNTSKVWEDVSEQVRTPLGSVKSRTLLSQDSVPAPPAGIEVLKFKTSFASKPEAVETVSMAPEDGGWRVTGYYIQ